MHTINSLTQTRLASHNTASVGAYVQCVFHLLNMASSVTGNHQHCCVPFCTNDGRIHQGISFHRLPKDPAKRKAWLHRIRRKEGPEHTFMVSPHVHSMPPSQVPSCNDFTLLLLMNDFTTPTVLSKILVHLLPSFENLIIFSHICQYKMGI